MRNFVLGISFALFISFIAAGAQNPASPEPGKYYIINFSSDFANNQLAATFNESNVIVTSFHDGVGLANQQWIITSDQSIKPVDAKSDAATAQNGTVVIAKENNFGWTIKNNGDPSQFYYYTIADKSQFWDLDKLEIDKPIVLSEESTARSTQRWKFVPVTITLSQFLGSFS